LSCPGRFSALLDCQPTILPTMRSLLWIIPSCALLLLHPRYISAGASFRYRNDSLSRPPLLPFNRVRPVPNTSSICCGIFTSPDGRKRLLPGQEIQRRNRRNTRGGELGEHTPYLLASSRRSTAKTPSPLPTSTTADYVGEEEYLKLSPLASAAMYAVTAAVDIGVSTSFAYLSSGVTGYIFSGAFGIRGGIKGLHSRALTGAKSWGELGAAFTGFGSAVRWARGGKMDKYSNLCSSCCAGAYLNRKKGPKAMASGCITYAGISYFFESMGSGGKARNDEYDDFDFEDRLVGE